MTNNGISDYGESELRGHEMKRSMTRGKTIARKRMSTMLLAANSADTWIGKTPHRVLYHCTTFHTRIGQAVIQKKDYRHEYSFILDNGLNQLAHGHILFK
jgi:hypothetical protein